MAVYLITLNILLFKPLILGHYITRGYRQMLKKFRLYGFLKNQQYYDYFFLFALRQIGAIMAKGLPSFPLSPRQKAYQP
jgi:hypothetical protein